MERKLTDNEVKWIKSLERCLKKMPDSIEILVQENYNNPTKIMSTIYAMSKGVIHESQEDLNDLIQYDPSEYALDSFSIEKVAANNHGY